MHSGTMSGPARSLVKRLPLTTVRAERIVYLPGHGPAAGAFSSIADVKVFEYGVLRVPRGPTDAARIALTFLRDVGKFWRRFRKDHVETVIASSTYTPAAVLAAFLSRKRLIVACGEIFSQSGDVRASKGVASRIVISITEHCADLIICCSATVREQFSTDSNAVVVYPRIETSAAPKPRAGASRVTDEEQGIVVAGSLTRGRGQDVAIRALALLRDAAPAARLLIAGEPLTEADIPFRDELSSMAFDAGLGDRVELLGFVEDTATLFADAAVVLNPCRFDEPFGRVAYEALAVGTPVVLSETGANTELLRDEVDALIVPPDDPDALAAAILRLLRSSDLRANLVEGAAQVLAIVDAEASDHVYLKSVKGLLGRG